MGKQYKNLTLEDINFIKEQKLFYLASCSTKEVNLSPKGYDSIRVIDNQTLAFANLPGSGNRTHRDSVENGEFTLVFNAFDGNPKILRLFCKSTIIDKNHQKYKNYLSLFSIKENVIRDIFEFNIYAVESSCGMSVPIMEFKEERNALIDWAIDADKKGTLEEYKEKRFNPPELKNI